MSLSEELSEEVASILSSRWTERDGTTVPDDDDIKLGNDAVNLDATVLYADLAESTELVTKYENWFAAEIYKAYLHCSAKVIRNKGGVITSYDGDRIMAVFIGDSKNTAAARAALNINYCVSQIINPKLHAQYPKRSDFNVKQAVGIDTSQLFIARTGIRGSNDLVWVGRSANYAAKLCALRKSNYASWITADVYNMLHASAKVYDGKDMWQKDTWPEYGVTVYRSSWWSKP